MLEVAFVRRRGHRDVVYVSRDDGTSTSWQFPAYGDGLPHDLCHLVVEQELGLTDGFWGLVDHGVDVGLVDNNATLIRNGKPLAEQGDVNFSGLREAEAAVAALAGPAIAAGGFGQPAVAGGFGQPAVAVGDTGEPAVAAIGERLRRLAEQWRRLDDGAAIRLVFSARLPRS